MFETNDFPMFTHEDIKEADSGGFLVFNQGEFVKMTIVSVIENVEKKSYRYVCRVEEPVEHDGKEYSVFVSLDFDPNYEWVKLRKRQALEFFRAFMTDEEVVAGEFKKSGRFMGKTFSAVAGKVRESNGKQYQSLNRYLLVEKENKLAPEAVGDRVPF